MPKFRKKPVVIEAVQWLNTTESFNAIQELNKDGNRSIVSIGGDPEIPESKPQLSIPTLEGDMRADLNDWIIKGVSGEVYPCKPDIFEKTYEIVN